LGDVKVKKFLIKVLEKELAPIRAERAKWASDIGSVYDILHEGTLKAQQKTNATLARVQSAMRIDYFKDRAIISEWEKLLKEANV
ncbi:MAG: hypothetical protein J5599_01360, partial [Spirochaetales bacterium]|nr:hypothetical protein [Spirochaetales bacterium]